MVSNQIFNVICISNLTISKWSCHFSGSIRQRLNESVVVDSGEETYLCSDDQNITQKDINTAVFIHLCESQTFINAAVTVMSCSIVFNKASEELSAPACSVRLIPRENTYVGKSLGKTLINWNVSWMVDTKSDIIPQHLMWWIMLAVRRLTARFHKLQ